MEKTFLETLKPRHSLFHSFCVRPHFRFSAQRKDEEIILVLRSHPITQISWIINAVFLLLGLIIVIPFVSSIFSLFQLVFLIVMGGSFIFSYMLYNIISWFFNVGIITTQRVIDIDFHAVIYREITEAKLSIIQDVTEKSGGFLESFVDYGDLFIQTAGTIQNVEFANIPKPSTVVRIINELRQY